MPALDPNCIGASRALPPSRPWAYTALRHTGWLMPLLLLGFGLALCFHLLSRLPHSYDAYRPFEIVAERLERPGTLTLLGVVWLFGKLRLRGAAGLGNATGTDSTSADAPAVAAAMPLNRLASVSLNVMLRPAVRALAWVAVFVGMVFAVMGRFPFPLDHLTIGVVVASFAASPGRWVHLRRALLQLAFGCLAFALTSYAFSVVKASLFLYSEPRDAWIVAAELKLFGGPLHQPLSQFMRQSVAWCKLLDQVYFSVFEHMIATGLFLTALGRGRERAQLLAALVVSYFVGAVCYHLLPALGPVFANPQDFRFLWEYKLQTADAVGWLHYNYVTTRDGTATSLSPYAHVAAMPSLHVAHELVMLWYARHSRAMTAFASALTVLTIVATLTLGWHYGLDLIAGALLAIGCVALVRKFDTTTMPCSWKLQDRILPARPPLLAAITLALRAPWQWMRRWLIDSVATEVIAPSEPD